MSEHIVLIHGLWMNGWDMGLLQYRFRRAGYATTRFKYDSTGYSPAENAGRLAILMNTLEAEHIHFICHSLGGLILRQYLARFPRARPGRTVMLGTPNNTSQAARIVASWPGGPRLLGKSTAQGLLGPLPAWPGGRALGVIAGALCLGAGMILTALPKPNDGAVAVAETRLAGMSDHITLPVSHAGLLLSKRVFRQTRHFIENACFERAPDILKRHFPCI